MFPLISEYIESIKSAEDNFDELKYLRPVLDKDGLPIMTNGNFAVVFKMKDKTSGKFYAVKCFTKEQEGREEAYHQITEELKDVDSPYLTSVRYMDKELFVDTDQTDETEFPVLLMDWVDGMTLDKYLRTNLDDKYALEMLAYRFSHLAQWLIPQPFAHGDLKPDNILVREDGSLVLVDYDGMYVPAMKGQKARELGSPDFRHPLRTVNDFDKHIDDFPLVSILISLIGISNNPHYLMKYGASDRLLFSAKDYNNINNLELINDLLLVNDTNLRTLTCVFTSLCYHCFPISISILKKPYKSTKIGYYDIAGVNILNQTRANTTKSLPIKQVLDGLIELDDILKANNIDYILTGSLGLYMHGLVPSSYIPHDIDIIFFDPDSQHSRLTNQMKLDLFAQYSGGKRSEYTDYYTSNIYVFYIGDERIEINAFLNSNNITTYSNFCHMTIAGRDIKVNNALSILKEKYKLCRVKDFHFHNDLQTIITSYFTHRQIPDSEIIDANISKDKIRTFLKDINFEPYQYGIEVFTILFDKRVKEKWLPNPLMEGYYIKVKSLYESTKETHLIIYGKQGHLANINKFDFNKLVEEWNKRDISYMVDSMYYIFSEMKILDFFIKNINEITNAVIRIGDDYKLPF